MPIRPALPLHAADAAADADPRCHAPASAVRAWPGTRTRRGRRRRIRHRSQHRRQFQYNFDLLGRSARDAWEAALGQARAAEVDQQAAQLTLAADVAPPIAIWVRRTSSMTWPAKTSTRTQQMLDLSQRRLTSGIDSQYQFQQTESLEATSRPA